MLASFLPLNYLSPLRSLTGATHSSGARLPVKDDASSDNCDTSVCAESQHHQPSMSSTRDTNYSYTSIDNGTFPPGVSSCSLDLASASVELDTCNLRCSGHSINNACITVNDLVPLASNDVLQNVASPVASPAPLFFLKNDALSLPFSSGTSISSDPSLLRYKAGMPPPRFPSGHRLDRLFLQNFRLDAELGSGGYGFVMAASRRVDDKEVAVKFIIKSKVPDHAWTRDPTVGLIPTEVLLLAMLDHPYIAKCLDLYEDDLYYYLVQEIHGSPWVPKVHKRSSAPGYLSAPELTPSSSASSTVDSDSDLPPFSLPDKDQGVCAEDLICYGNAISHQDIISLDQEAFLDPVTFFRPEFSRRPSHDLFECIEQLPQKRLSEGQARYVFAQVVEAVAYLDAQGITHCDIKDENILIDTDLHVKLVDFGSAVIADPTEPRPYYNLFFGTTAYASSEVLRKKPYRAAPAEIWTLGVLLSYLLTGHSPFLTEEDAREGSIREELERELSRNAVGIMKMCLEADPEQRARIEDVRRHRWLAGALDR